MSGRFGQAAFLTLTFFVSAQFTACAGYPPSNAVSGATFGAAPSFTYPSAPPEFLVSLPTTDQVALVDAKTETVKQYFNMGFAPGEIVVDPSHPYAYMNNAGSFVVFDLIRNKVRETFAVPSDLSHLAFGRGGEVIYGISNGAIDAVTTHLGSVRKVISYTAPISSFAQSVLTGDIFASVPSQGNVIVVDPASGQIVHTITVPPCIYGHVCHPDQLVASDDGRFILGVADTRSNGIVTYDAQTYAQVSYHFHVGCHGWPITLIGVNRAMDQAWYKGLCYYRNYDVLRVVNMGSASNSTGAPTGFVPIHYGRVAFDAAGQIGLVTYATPTESGLLSIAGPPMKILMQTTPTWITFAP